TQTLTLSAGSLNATNISTQTTNGAISLAGGTIANATINLTNGTSLIVQSGTFNGVTMSGTLDVGNSVNAADLTVTNGLVLDGTALVGNPTNSNAGYITFGGSQTLGGTGTVVFGDNATYNALRLVNGGTTLTIGSGITVEGQNGTIGYSSAWGGPQNVSVVNQGVISADVSGGTISIEAQPFSNQGTLTAPIGTLSLSGTYNLAGGSINVGISGLSTFGHINFAGTVSLAGTLSATLTNGFVPAGGSSFTILTYG